ncbi:MAG: hypothetical protein V3W18_00580 [candidate division Zixibacteria bacterium]
MKNALILSLVMVIITGLATAQTTKLIFGPRDGDNAGILEVGANEVFDLQLWIRTAPDINIVGIHLPLSSNNLYVQSDFYVWGDVFYPLTLWESITYFNPIDDPNNDGHTVCSFMGVKDFPRDPFPEWGINTDGEWWLVANYRMTATDEVGEGAYCNAFIEGYHPYNEGFVLADWLGEVLDRSMYELEFACLNINESVCGYYLPGDFNGNWEFNVADIIASFSKLKTGSPESGFFCECPAGSGVDWAVAMDVNNNCIFNIADVIAAFSKLKTGSPELVPCEYCPPWDES